MKGIGGAFRRARRSNGSNGNGYNTNGNILPSRRLPVRLKPVAAILAAVAVLTWTTMAVMYYRYDMMVLGFYRREFLDGGPGPAWIPPDKRPVPLKAFPDFSRMGYTSKGKLNLKGAAANMSAVVGEEPPVTLLFMHLWKCAGSSLRHMLRDWAHLEGQSIGIVVRCTDTVNMVSGRRDGIRLG